MSRFNRQPSSEYVELKRAIEEYADSDNEPGERVMRVVADALEDNLRESFKANFDLDRTTDGANCIGRLIAGWDSCHHGGLRQKGDDSDHPPHNPPHADHANLWLRDGEAAVFDMHLYDTDRDVLRDVVDFADEHGLEIDINPSSYYYLGSTTHFIFYTPEWRRSLGQEE